MESRPWYKKLLGSKADPVVKPPVQKTVHEFPLSQPKLEARHRYMRRGRNKGKPRHPIIRQQVTDPRFNHALRPSHIARRHKAELAWP